MAITLLPTPPSRQDPANFNVRADAFLGALPNFGTEANALATDVNAKQATASSAATTATNAASTATTKADEASTSASAATSARIAAEAALDSFDDRYLGQKPANPATDNDGGALLVGALYFRTTAPIGMKVWTGSAWDDAYANLSSKFDKTGGAISGGISVAGNILSTGGAIGYGVGAGGTVVQATSKSTDVTLNKPSGYITTSNSALAGGATVVFRFNNSNISADGSDVILFTVAGYDADRYTVAASIFAPGVCSVLIKNNTAASLSEAIPINFAVIKAARS